MRDDGATVPPILCFPCSKPSLSQWYSLSVPEREYSFITRIDFQLFYRFDDFRIPDHSTLCRFHNWLAQDDSLARLLELINRQLVEKGLKVEKAAAAVIAATIIHTTGSGKQRQAIEVDDSGQIRQKPSRAKTRMPGGSKKTATSISVANNTPAPMPTTISRKSILPRQRP